VDWADRNRRVAGSHERYRRQTFHLELRLRVPVNNRCITASSFFEWKKTGSEPRPKYRLTAKGRNTLGMAGIWVPFQNPKTGQWEDTFAIITSDPNAKMGEIHTRQPVIFELREYAEWLTEDERPPVHLLRILPDDLEIDSLQVEPKVKRKKRYRGRLCAGCSMAFEIHLAWMNAVNK
jgi:putative SOS response-associated peptidase YedK